MRGLLQRLLNLVVHARESPERALSLADSLEAARLEYIEWRGRYSRTGATFFLQGLRARLRTSKYEHELDCRAIEPHTLMCTWTVNGREVGTIEITPEDSVYRELVEAVEFALRSERVEENALEMRDRPIVEVSPY